MRHLIQALLILLCVVMILLTASNVYTAFWCRKHDGIMMEYPFTITCHMQKKETTNG